MISLDDLEGNNGGVNLTPLYNQLNLLNINTSSLRIDVDAINNSISTMTNFNTDIINSFNSLSTEFAYSFSTLNNNTSILSTQLTSIWEFVSTLTGSSYTFENLNNQYFMGATDTYCVLNKINKTGEFLVLKEKDYYNGLGMLETVYLKSYKYSTLYISHVDNHTYSNNSQYYDYRLSDCTITNLIINLGNVPLSPTSYSLHYKMLCGADSNYYQNIPSVDFIAGVSQGSGLFKWLNISTLNVISSSRWLYPFCECNIHNLKLDNDKAFECFLDSCTISTLNLSSAYTYRTLYTSECFIKNCTLEYLRFGLDLVTNTRCTYNCLAKCSFINNNIGHTYTLCFNSNNSTAWAASSAQLTQSYLNIIIDPTKSNTFYSQTATLPSGYMDTTTITRYYITIISELV